MPEKKSVSSPDETRKFENGRIEVFNFEGGTVGRLVLEPGWVWSNDVKPVAGTDLCETPHFGYQVAGTLHVKMADGREFEMKPGDIGIIEPGHDAWVVGDEAVVNIDWTGAANYAKR
jgi:hypothetical protein